MTNTVQEHADNVAEGVEKYPLPYTLHLKKPIVLSSEKTINSLEFSREPEAIVLGEISLSGKNMKAKELFPVIQFMTKQPQQIIHKLKNADLMECLGIASHFLTDGQTTGDDI